MNLKNLIMWAIIVLLSVGLFNMFQDPKKVNSEKNNLPFSNFLSEVEAGRVVEVQIQGNNISGVLSDGKTFTTYSPNFDISLFLIILTIIGGSVISTSSGFKYVRFYILLKTSYREIYKLVKPNNIFSKNLFNTESQIDDNDSRVAFLVFISFIISLFILSSILTFDNMSFENSFKLSILTLTNTVTSSLYGFDNSNFFYLNNITKLSLIVFMIFGKIEIIAILFLIKKFIFKE